MKRITITSIARADAAEAAEYIAGESPDGALRFLESLERSLLEIQTFPYIGREAEFETDLPVRFWFVKHFPNYLIFY
ncbi:MAG: type II toxin-antitoxin system RelE/ParE family toxin, partial [Aridibacter famidurans]|nr:type II toxin-antitoxin system RelE/ParE family toxin [Aridibacter famidurans]